MLFNFGEGERTGIRGKNHAADADRHDPGPGNDAEFNRRARANPATFYPRDGAAVENDYFMQYGLFPHTILKASSE